MESLAESVILNGYARDAQLYDLLSRYEIPFVISWSTSPDPDVPSISFDNYAASLDAVGGCYPSATGASRSSAQSRR